VAHALHGLGQTSLDAAAPAEAIAPLERALDLCLTNEGDPAFLAEIRFTLAQALSDAPAGQGRDEARARELAQLARTTYAEAGDLRAEEIATIDAWLAEHGEPDDEQGEQGDH
jgi:eukaryotic-like serine/threonine-protein kinase